MLGRPTLLRDGTSRESGQLAKRWALPGHQRDVVIFALLTGLRQSNVLGLEWLQRGLTFNGKPIKQANARAWYATLERVGIKDFRWHDLRHTWATWHRQAGTPTHELQRLGG